MHLKRNLFLQSFGHLSRLLCNKVITNFNKDVNKIGIFTKHYIFV